MILEVDAVDTFYGETQALFGASLAVERAKVFALLGPNGAGKTTMLRSILGLTRPRRGAIRFDGRDVTRSPTHEIARAGIGWVPDDRRLCPTLTVARNLRIAQKRTQFRAWSIKETCEIFSPLEYLMERECENLSGGEMQMVAIARALVGAPGLILFDEPSQGLAPKIVGDVLATIRKLREAGVASLVVEQNAEIALSVADHAAVIDRGRIAWTGDAQTLREDGALRARLLGSSLMAAPLLALDRVRKVYTRGRIVRRPTFTLEADLVIDQPGIIGVVGPNGAGKTTLFEMMTGSNVPSAGHVYVAGTDIHRVKYRERDRLAIHYHQSYQVRRFRKAGAVGLSAWGRRPRHRWCICSTSRSSTCRTAISASCSISSASCAPRAGWWCCACTRPRAGIWKSSPRYPSNSCWSPTAASRGNRISGRW